MEVLAYDERQRPYVAVIVAVLTAVLAAVIGAGAVWLLHPRNAAAAGTSGSSPSPRGCADALQHADLALRDVRAVQQVLATQTRVINDLLARRVSVDEAMRQALPSLTAGSQQSVRLDQDAAAYSAAASHCRGR